MRILSALILLAVTAHADEPDYVRFVENDKGASLETAITSFTNKAGVTVDLVGAVHIADKSYYTDLNQRFQNYDAVLYELVGGPMPKEGDIDDRPRDPKLMWISELHVRLQKALELASQLKEVHYQVPNFVHADMTVEQFQAAKEEKNESFLRLMAKAFLVQSDLLDKGQARQSPNLIKLLEILCRQDSATELKRLVGREFDSMETLMAGLESGEGTVIVTERNKIAFGVMDREIKAGRKRLALFYGAAHLPSMEKMLIERGFTKMKSEWVKAWTLPPEPKSPAPAPTPSKP